MRVISGQFKGRKLKTLRGLDLRPTSDRLKETLFNIIYQKVPGSRFLDCFAGSGAIGIEALSRGAQNVVFVEKNPHAARIIKENLEEFHVPVNYEVFKMPAFAAIKYLGESRRSFDIIFLDPPYAAGVYTKTIGFIYEHRLLTSEGILIVEHRSKEPLASDFETMGLYRTVKQGESRLSFFKLGAS